MDEAPTPNGGLSEMARQLLGKKPEQHRAGEATHAPPGNQPQGPQKRFDKVHHPEVYARVRKHIQSKIKSLGG